MAVFRLTAAPRYPTGTVIGAYLKRLFPGPPPQAGQAPGVSPVTTATVVSNGTAEFTGLEAEAAYYAGAQVGGVYVWTAFATPGSAAVSGAESSALAAITTAEAAALAALEGVGKTFRLMETLRAEGEILLANTPCFFVSLAAGETAELSKIRYRIREGTSCSFKLQRNGADMAGFGTSGSPLVATSTPASTVGGVACGEDDRIQLVVIARSGSPLDLAVSCFFGATA